MIFSHPDRKTLKNWLLQMFSDHVTMNLQSKLKNIIFKERKALERKTTMVEKNAGFDSLLPSEFKQDFLDFFACVQEQADDEVSEKFSEESKDEV